MVESQRLYLREDLDAATRIFDRFKALEPDEEPEVNERRAFALADIKERMKELQEELDDLDE